MTGAELKAWRESAGLTQKEAAGRVGKTWRTLARWEAAPDAEIPRTAADLLQGKRTADAPAPKPQKPAAKVVPIKPGASLLQLREAARAEVASMPPRWLKGARRPTAQERADSRFTGPNVWVVDHSPPQRHRSITARATVYRFAANGEGSPSLVLIPAHG